MTRPGETFIVWCLTRQSAHSLRGKTIDKSARELTWQPLILDVCAVVPAAGFGRQMQTECPKQYLSIGNQTILEHSVHALLAHPG